MSTMMLRVRVRVCNAMHEVVAISLARARKVRCATCRAGQRARGRVVGRARARRIRNSGTRARRLPSMRAWSCGLGPEFGLRGWLFYFF